MTLESLAREVGVLQSDKSTPCVRQDSPSTSLSPDTTDRSQCIVQLFGHELNTSSFTLYSFSLAIIVQTLVLISIGAIADYGMSNLIIHCCDCELTRSTGSNRKRLLLVLSFTGSTACMLFIFVHPGIFLVGLFLTIVSVASLGSSFVLLNSFLPLLVANHSSISQGQEFHSVPLDNVLSVSEDSDGDSDINNDDDGGSDDDNDNDGDIPDNEDLAQDRLATVALLNRLPQQALSTVPGDVSPSLKLSNIISSKGIGFGYAASVLVQVISITIIFVYRQAQASGSKISTTMPLRTVLFLVGFVWAAFTVPTACWLRRRPGPPLPWNVGNKKSRGGIVPGLRYMLFSWVSLWRTILIAVQLREVLKFLLGWFLLSDGIATITGTAILFAKVELQLGAAAIALLSITATASGIVGALCWPMIGRCWNIKPISILLSCICLFELIPLYGLLGFVPFIKSLGFLGLQKWWEIYPLGALLGFIMGGISSYARSIFGTLIPPGMEAAFYALYAVTDKGSSVIGPAVVGRIIDITGSIRMGFWFLAILMISPAPFFWFVDVEKGRESGLIMAEKRNLSHANESSIHM